MSLGDLRYHIFLNHLFRKIGPPIERCGGSVHRYVGDEMIVPWRGDAGTADAACLRCAMAILASVEQSEDVFRDKRGSASQAFRQVGRFP